MDYPAQTNKPTEPIRVNFDPFPLHMPQVTPRIIKEIKRMERAILQIVIDTRKERISIFIAPMI